ncbi:hypothetical protein K470DRAFT_246362 [Piedraia hortae CBS 480.64]|uniref:Pre-mRNA polyadenylation factor Fip1 domain-containing protein n=1 Tax=Piedraia hortae CBS 480.64 TaxID=1314780 RepID=A0A6A7C0J2_9PEZI|nr:hypothetical protein K470DRAFT_246362 [Piedraia hortae CBS 480.64]
MEHSKPWRLPGTDQTDYFNYGFDEYTWTQYCIKQQSMTHTIADQRMADAQLKAMFGGGMEDMMQAMMNGQVGPPPPGFEQMMQMPPMPSMGGPVGGPMGGPMGSQMGGQIGGQMGGTPGPGQPFNPPQAPQQMGVHAQRGRRGRGRW